MFCVIIQLYQHVFVEMNVSRYIRSAAAILLLATAFFSYAVVRENKDHLTSRFVVELGQNLHFCGVVLTYLLWGAILKLRETRTRLIQLVLALGVYFSATAGTYALRNLFPGLQESVLRWVPPLIGTWLPLAWAYTFSKVPEDARLTTARLLVRAR
jgi:VanZ family protein